MKIASAYQPPFSITPVILRHITDISETVGRISAQADGALDLRLRRVNRIRTIQGSLAIPVLTAGLLRLWRRGLLK